jgi:hypothetical protein
MKLTLALMAILAAPMASAQSNTSIADQLRELGIAAPADPDAQVYDGPDIIAEGSGEKWAEEETRPQISRTTTRHRDRGRDYRSRQRSYDRNR